MHSCRETPMREQPNVVLVVLDTVRRDRVSAYGYHRETTPAFDSFATDWTLFEDAVSQASWSIPAHASLFTGKYPTEHGATTVRPMLQADRTLATALSAAGYRTYAVSPNEFVRPATGFGDGFDEFHTGSRVTVPSRVASAVAPAVHRVTGDPRVRRSAERLFNAWRLSARNTGTASPSAGHLSRCVEGVLDETHEPFFLFVNLLDTHLPRSPEPEYADAFVDDDLSEIEVVANERAHTFGGHRLSRRAMRKMSQLYDADLRTMDDRLGDLLATLESRQLLDDSLVILVSDHGEHLGEFGLLGHQHSVFEAVVSVPLAIRFPNGGPDRVSAQVETRRVFHTILDETGVVSSPSLSLASGAGDDAARGSFASPMLDLEQFIWDGTVEYDPDLLGEPLSFVRDGAVKHVRFAGTEWVFELPESEASSLSRSPGYLSDRLRDSAAEP